MNTLDIFEQLEINFQDRVERNFDFWLVRLGSRKKALIHLRNRAIDDTINQWIKSSPKALFDLANPLVDVVVCEERANHYGVPIGTVLSTTYSKRACFDNRVARMTKWLRDDAICSNLVENELIKVK